MEGLKTLNDSISARHILAPVDLGDGSRPALQYVRFLARTCGARVTLFYVPALEDDALMDDEDLRIHEAAVREYADSFFEELPYDVIVAETDPVIAVPQMAREIGADLIVMGKLGRGRIDRAIASAFPESAVGRSDRTFSALN